MAVNTNQQNDGQYVTTSSISIVGGPSRTTLIAQDVTATSVLSSAAIQGTTIRAYSTLSATGATRLGSTVSIDGAVQLGSYLTVIGQVSASQVSVTGKVTTSTLSVTGAAQMESYLTVLGQVSASQLSVTGNVTASSGTATTLNVTSNRYSIHVSSGTTAQSGATAKLGDGQLFFSVLSLTSNGAEFGFRSGNTVYRFTSDLAG